MAQSVVSMDVIETGSADAGSGVQRSDVVNLSEVTLSSEKHQRSQPGHGY